jgi:hypothetical protein
MLGLSRLRFTLVAAAALTTTTAAWAVVPSQPASGPAAPTAPAAVVDDSRVAVHEPNHVQAAASPAARPPVRRVVVPATRSSAAPRSRTAARHVEPGDDRGTHVEPGDDRGTHVEPGDDSGGGRGSSGRGR